MIMEETIITIYYESESQRDINQAIWRMRDKVHREKFSIYYHACVNRGIKPKQNAIIKEERINEGRQWININDTERVIFYTGLFKKQNGALTVKIEHKEI